MDENAADLWRRIVPPLVTVFALFLVLLRSAIRRPVIARPVPAPPSWRAFFRYLLVTVGGGYVALLVIVLVFHVILARDPGALRSAAAGGAFLAFGVVVPVFTGSEWARRRRAQRMEQP